MRLHREGFAIIFVTTLVLAILNFGVQWMLGEGLVFQIILGLSLFFFIMVVQFFRNPSRTTPKGEGLIIAPADGKVVVIENVEEGEYFKDQRKQVSIFM
jgi:phosphatidylserine decarboxylase